MTEKRAFKKIEKLTKKLDSCISMDRIDIVREKISVYLDIVAAIQRGK